MTDSDSASYGDDDDYDDDFDDEDGDVGLEAIDSSIKESYEYQELKRLRKLKRMQQRDASIGIAEHAVHFGFKVPTAGSLVWHCAVSITRSLAHSLL